MKAIFLSSLLLVLFLTSCSKDGNDNFLKPPSWLIGEWERDSSDLNNIDEYIFTNDNIIYKKRSDLTFDYREYYTNNFGSTIKELTISDSEYSFKTTNLSGTSSSTATTILVKISDTEFEFNSIGDFSSTENVVYKKIN